MKNTNNIAAKRRKIADASFLTLLALSIVAGAALYMRDGAGPILNVLFSNLGFIIILLPKMMAGLFVAAALPLLIARETIVRALGQESGLRGLGIATLAGMLIPGGPFMIFSLAASLLSSGAHSATLVAFITSWSLLGINRTLIWEWSFLGVGFVIPRYLICLPMPIICGLLSRRLMQR